MTPHVLMAQMCHETPCMLLRHLKCLHKGARCQLMFSLDGESAPAFMRVGPILQANFQNVVHILACRQLPTHAATTAQPCRVKVAKAPRNPK